MRISFSRLAAVASICVVGAVAAIGLAAGPAVLGQEENTVPLVAVEFRAVGDEGHPVLDLKRQDVVLKVGGRAREIRSLELVHPESGARPFMTNTLADAGQDVLLVLDEDSIAPGREQPVRDAVGQLLAGLSPRDRVGLVKISVAGGNASSTRRGGIEEVLAGFASRAGRGETTDDIACRTQITLRALAGIFEDMLPDQPTTVVVFSAGMAAASAQAEQMQASSGFCGEVRLRHFQAFASAALGARASFYVVHLLDGQALAASASTYQAAGVESLAGAGGGTLLRVAGDGQGRMTRLAREISDYYQATFEPEAAERDGTRRRLDVQVARQGLKVRARPEILIPKVVARAAAKGPSPREMMRLPTVYRDLPLRATAYSSRNAGDAKIKVVVVFEPLDPAVALTSAMVGLFDNRGKLAAQWTAQGSDLAQAPFMAALVVPPGNYRLRLAANDRSGRSGSVDDEIQVALTGAVSLTVSALVLGVSENRAFSPRLQFGAEPAAIGYFEIYGAARDASVTASLELAPAADAPALVSVPATIERAPGGDLRIAYGVIPIETLQAADFVVRAIVVVDGQPAGRVTRILRKTGRD